MNKTNQINGETNTESNNSFNWKANELILWMDNTEELYNLKQAWMISYVRKARKGKFDLQKGLKGMDLLRKQIQQHYNKNFPDDRITVNKEEKELIQAAFLKDISMSIIAEGLGKLPETE